LVISAAFLLAPAQSRASGVPLVEIQQISMCQSGSCPEVDIDIGVLDAVARHAGLAFRVLPTLTPDAPFENILLSTDALDVLVRFGLLLARDSGVSNRIYAGYAVWDDSDISLGTA
jgi:hypothetical protein